MLTLAPATTHGVTKRQCSQVLMHSDASHRFQADSAARILVFISLFYVRALVFMCSFLCYAAMHNKRRLKRIAGLPSIRRLTCRNVQRADEIHRRRLLGRCRTLCLHDHRPDIRRSSLLAAHPH